MRDAGQQQAQQAEARHYYNEKKHQPDRAKRLAFHGIDAGVYKGIDLGLIFWG